MRFNVTLSIAVATIALTGCQTNKIKSPEVSFYESPEKYTKSYGFLDSDKESFYSLLKTETATPPTNNRNDNTPKLKLFLGSPHGYSLCFINDMSKPLMLGNELSKLNKIKPGLYPFKLVKNQTYESAPDKVFADCKDTSSENYSGALGVYNIDKETALVVLGKKEGEEVFNSKHIEKAGSGVLASYQMEFEGKEIFNYWLGNRKSIYNFDNPDIELDFSVIDGIEQVSINNQPVKNNIAVLTVAAQVAKIDPYGREYIEKTNLTYELTLRLKNGKEFKGYVKNLADDEFSAFMKIPVMISKDLFDAAEQGTLAKLNITTNEGKSTVGEVVFGLN